MIRKTLKPSEILWIVIILMFFLQDPIQEKLEYWSFFDEGLTLCALLYVVLVTLSKTGGAFKVERWKLSVILLSSSMIFVGILANLFYGLQNVIYIAIDLLSYLKFFAFLYVGWMIHLNSISSRFKKVLIALCKGFLIVQIVLIIHEELFDPWFPYMADFYGLKSLKLFYSSQTYLVSYSLLYICVIVLLDGLKKNGLYVLLSVICMISSFRSKAIGFLVVMLLIYGITKRIKIRRPLLFAVFVAPVVAFAVKDKIILYFFDDTHFSPRRLILQEGFKIAVEYFPLGAGFGTFCSPGANIGGSLLYDRFGIMYQYMTTSINDMYWGYLIGQFGFFGVLFFCGIILVLIRRLWRLQTIRADYFIVGISLMMYLIIASIGETSFFSPYAVGYALLMGIVLNTENYKI